ncbi:MAG: hypothetical protein ACRD21_23230, partial [Vicinamibacteria bacterium]
MASDPLAARSRLPEQKRGLIRFLLRTRFGQILALLLVIRLLGAILASSPSWPSWLTTASTIGLWSYAVFFLFWRIGRLRNKLLWRIRRKLVISYLLIGLVPTLLILSFFLLSAFFIIGQVSSFVLNSEIRRIDGEMVKSADLAVSDIQGLRRNGAHVPDDAVRAVLEARVGPVSALFPGSSALYLEHRRGRVQRVIAPKDFAHAPQVGTTLPSWMESAYRGPIRFRHKSFLGGVSGPLTPSGPEVDPGSSKKPPRGNQPLEPLPEGLTVLVVSPLEAVLDAAAEAMGFHIDQVVTSVPDEEQERAVLVIDPDPSSASSSSPGGEAGRPFTLPWLTLLQSQGFDDPRTEEGDLIFVQFGFSPMSLYDGIARNALQLGPDGPDLGKVILWALALLAGLFLVIEVSAIFVGLVLARS